MVAVEATGSVEGLARLLLERLGGPPCGVAVDVDGTLTERRRRGDFRVSLEAVAALREAVDTGLVVMLVTGNSASVAAGLARYLGVNGPVVAENGCIVYHRGRLYNSCRWTARAAARLVMEELGSTLTPSWQNRCRLHDYAFLAPRERDPGEYVRLVEEVLRERGVAAKVSSSGYAIHLRPLDAGKGRGLALAARLAGIREACMVAVGDSPMDAEMKPPAALLAAVGNADPGLKRAADLVLPGESGGSAALLLRAAALARSLAGERASTG